jgi:hypothetical protein
MGKCLALFAQIWGGGRTRETRREKKYNRTEAFKKGRKKKTLRKK